MPLYRVDIAADRYAPFPPIESLPEFDAESPLDAIRQALDQSPLSGRELVWARVVVGTLPDGNFRVLSIPLTREGTIPLDWAPPQ